MYISVCVDDAAAVGNLLKLVDRRDLDHSSFSFLFTKTASLSHFQELRILLHYVHEDSIDVTSELAVDFLLFFQGTFHLRKIKQLYNTNNDLSKFLSRKWTNI